MIRYVLSGAKKEYDLRIIDNNEKNIIEAKIKLLNLKETHNLKDLILEYLESTIKFD